MGRQRVDVTLARYESQDEAVEAIHRYARGQRGEQIHGLGDEAYVYGLDGNIVFRAGNIIVYVSPTVNKSVDPDAGINDLTAAANAGHAAAAPLARGFAQRIASVLNNLQ